MSKREEKLKSILLELEKNSEVNNSAIVNLQGQMMAHAMHSDTNGKGVSAMTAALTSVASRVSQVLESGDTSSILINGNEKNIIVRVLTNAALIALTPSDAKIGLVEFELDNAEKKIKSILN